MNFKHGEARRGKRTKEFLAYRDMIQRCYNFAMKGRAFRDYGGRGISVCDRWLEPNGLGFKNFLADMGRAPSKAHSLDREKVDGHYEKDNCRWLDYYGQALNRRSTRWIVCRGHTKCLTDWARFFGVTRTAMWAMVNRRGGTEAIECYLTKKGITLGHLEPPATVTDVRALLTGKVQPSDFVEDGLSPRDKLRRAN